MATKTDLDAFLADVDELKALVEQLIEARARLETKARNMAPRYNPSAAGFMALPRLYHEVGVMLDGFVYDIAEEAGDPLDAATLLSEVHDLIDVVEIAKSPRAAVTVDA